MSDESRQHLPRDFTHVWLSRASANSSKGIALGMPVGVAPMADPHDLYNQATVDHLIDDSVISDAHSVHRVLADESDASGWSRLGGQEVYRSSNPDLIGTGQPSDRPDRAPSDLDLVPPH